MAYKVLGNSIPIIDDSRNILNATAVGIGTTNPTSKLWVDGDGYFTGVTTASLFVSTVAQGTAPISVASSTLVTNLNSQYLNGQSGAYYNSANNLTGTAPASVITQSSGLSVNGNLSVSGDVSIGGTFFLVNAGTLQVKDKDIVLGITTNASNQDVSTDITANHGGVAIASTEGTPLIDINGGVGTDSIPSTYKQIMWLKSGSWTGLGTDAWLFNYGVGIGSTQVPNGVRLAVGAVQFTQNDLSVVRNIHSTGFVTATSFIGSGTSLTSLTAGNLSGTIPSAVLGNSTLYVGTTAIALNRASASQSLTGITSIDGSAASLTNTRTLWGQNFNGTANVTGTLTSVGNITGTGAVTLTATSGALALTATGANIITASTNNTERVRVFGTGEVGIGTTVLTGTSSQLLQVNSGAYIGGNLGIGTTNPLQRLQVGTANTLGINTNGTVFVVTSNADVGIGTTNPTSKLHVIGDGRFTGVITATSFSGSGANLTGLVPNTVSTSSTTTPQFIGFLTTSSGVTTSILASSTLTFIPSSGNLGIGTTNPQAKLDVNGSVRFRSSITDNNNATGSANQVLTATSAGAGVSWASLTAASVGALSNVTVTNDTSTATPLFPIFTSSTGTNITGVNVDTSGLTFIPTGSGSLGIGTTSPTRNLDVNGTVRFRSGIYDVNNTVGSANSVLTADGNGGWSWQPVVSGGGGAISGINVTQDDTGVRYPLLAAGTNTSTTTQYVDTTDLVYDTNTNCLGIGSTTPTSRLDIIGDVKVVGIVTASDFNSSSDIKLKTNIQRIANPIEKVLQINGVSFNWKESGKATMGVIAQEVEAVLPELVSDTDPKSVNYNGLIGLLIECIKDQQRQIDELRNIT